MSQILVKKILQLTKLNISMNGVTKLLQNINTSKSSGPDHIPGASFNTYSPSVMA